MRYQGPTFSERTACFLCDFWWLVLAILAALIALFSTHCLWLPSSCPARIRVQNSTPYELKIVFQGLESETLTLPACATCEVYQGDAPSECTSVGTKKTLELDPGFYGVTAGAADNPLNPLPYVGVLTINPHETEESCFIVTENGFFGLGINLTLPELTPEPTVGPTEAPTATVQPTEPGATLDYQSDAMGVGINFPETWSGIETSNLITLDTDHNSHIEITKVALALGMTISQYIDSYFEESEFVKSDEREESINDIPWTIITYTSSGQNWQVETYNTLMDDQLLSVRYYNQIENSDVDQDSDDANFLQMIQTIQLTPGMGQ